MSVPELSLRARKGIARALSKKPLPIEGAMLGDQMWSFTPRSVSDLTADELLAERGLGRTALREVRGWLARYGRRLAGDAPPWDAAAANVYADWLEDNDEPAAAAKLRAAFPLADGST